MALIGESANWFFPMLVASSELSIQIGVWRCAALRFAFSRDFF
jgi:hypothetical protein